MDFRQARLGSATFHRPARWADLATTILDLVDLVDRGDQHRAGTALACPCTTATETGGRRGRHHPGVLEVRRRPRVAATESRRWTQWIGIGGQSAHLLLGQLTAWAQAQGQLQGPDQLISEILGRRA